MADARDVSKIHRENTKDVKKPQDDSDHNHDIQDFLEWLGHRDITIYQPHQDPDHNKNYDNCDDWHWTSDVTGPQNTCLFKLEQETIALDAET
jgi:hypothetical protein